MTWVAVAIGGSAVVGAGASVYAGNKAAGATNSATNASIGEQARQYNQTREDFAKQRGLGNSALDQLARLYGFATPATEGKFDPAAYLAANSDVAKNTYFAQNPEEHYRRYGVNEGRQGTFTGGTPGVAASAPDASAFFESPDYQFNLAEGQKAIDRSLVARGRGLSGAGVKEGVRYASGMASQQIGDFTNRLLTIAGLGNAATSNTVAAGQNMANNNSAALINAGNQRASTYGQTAAGVNNSVQGGISNYMLSQYLKKPVT
jgi:hypothetical protein